MKNIIALNLTFLLINFVQAQSEEFIQYYENGQIKYQCFLKDSLLIGSYKEYYKGYNKLGRLKTEGLLKDCEYPIKNDHLTLNDYTNDYTKTYDVGFGIPNNLPYKRSRKHGEWKQYFNNGKLESVYNFNCGLRDGSFYHYRENGDLGFFEYYEADKIIEEKTYYNEGKLKTHTKYSYKYNEKENRDLKTTIETEYFENKIIKTKRIVKEFAGNVLKENLKEYYTNGVLKTETYLIDFTKNGNYIEYHQNGKIKYKATFKNGFTIGDELHYDANGKLIKIENDNTRKTPKIAD